MNDLKELIGTKVNAVFYDVFDKKGHTISIAGVVESLDIDDYYYLEKDENIHITVSILPSSDNYLDGIDIDLHEHINETLSSFSIDDMRKA